MGLATSSINPTEPLSSDPLSELHCIWKFYAVNQVSLHLVVLQLGLAVEGQAAGAARGGDLDPLVDDHDVVP